MYYNNNNKRQKFHLTPPPPPETFLPRPLVQRIHQIKVAYLAGVLWVILEKSGIRSNSLPALCGRKDGMATRAV